MPIESQIEQAIASIERRAFDVRLPISKVCERAGVAPSTISRWRAKAVEPHPGTIERLENALTDIERERAAA